MQEISASERIRYRDTNGKYWSGKLTTEEGRAGRKFSFELESEDTNLPSGAGQIIADEIESKNWLELQSEGGRHLRLNDILITYFSQMAGSDLHGLKPHTLRGIGHNLIESRFAFKADDALIISMVFAPASALLIMADKWFECDDHGRLTPRSKEIRCHEIAGLGKVTFRLDASREQSAKQATLRGYCGITVVLDQPIGLDNAIEIGRVFPLFLDFLFGKPMPSPKMALAVAGGQLTLLLGGIPHSSDGQESHGSAVLLTSGADVQPKQITWETFFKALEIFWTKRARLVQPVNVALMAFHSDLDMLSRFFVTLPTLDHFLPEPDMTEIVARVDEMKKAFLVYAKENSLETDCCSRFKQLCHEAKRATYAMKLDPAIVRIREGGWQIPSDASTHIKRLRDNMAHSARLDKVGSIALWPLLATSATILIGQVLQELGIPLAAVHTHMGSNYRSIGQLPHILVTK